MGSFIGNFAKIDGDCALLLRFRAVIVSVCAYLGCFCALRTGLRSFYWELRQNQWGLRSPASVSRCYFACLRLSGMFLHFENGFALFLLGIAPKSMGIALPCFDFTLLLCLFALIWDVFALGERVCALLLGIAPKSMGIALFCFGFALLFCLFALIWEVFAL
ncbi:hypothetical protein AADC60_05220 [Cytobacillus pseudoceanisediminis]|uniref:Uncharacterized protein n=1 Tax=Cytobacillus pseudoceanisediminis TaxID=3051614 RepID=A0ABZ2ZK93_9BACI